ncbi:hypothetical protein ACFQ05_03015 [Amycolatopsis umgeniensis]|uniref:Uncharacterized protein n=1 Tax=Amycolatopsis umgeniensis TaxID=336628 RepID=A0A841B0U1_9PSEU|nr:hypothetical protein [Amycolatopsis umgeniensis]MBB5852232.1 hypothetical protein [Amycolatopsis umgeniensis]
MAERKPGWVNGVDARDARLVTGTSFQAETGGDSLDPLRVRQGIRWTAGDPGKVVLDAGKLKITPFQALLSNKNNPADGPYSVSLDAVKELPLGAAHPTLQRIDLVVAEIIGNEFVVNLYAGESKDPPSRPPTNNTASAIMELAEIRVRKVGEQPEFTDRRRFTAATGGILPLTRALEAPSSAQAYPGQFAYRLDSGELQVFQGGAWKRFAQPRDRDRWKPLSPANGWQVYNSQRYHGPEMLVDDQGFVQLRGLIKGSGAKDVTPTPIGTTASLALELSSWPTKEMIVPILIDGAPHRANILPNGQFWIPRPAGGYPTWVSLDGLSFPAF